MRIKSWNRALGLGTALLMAGSWASAQEAQPPQEQEALEIELVGEEGTPARTKLYRRVLALQGGESGEEGKAGDSYSYWIGVQLRTLDDLALAQLNLKQAVAAEDVLADSPAAKAGVQRHDILLRFGDSPIAAPQDLVEAVGKHQDKEVELHVLRGGKEAKLKVTAIKRPTTGKLTIVDPTKDSDEVRRVEAWVERLKRTGEGGDPKDFIFMRPGVMVERLALLQQPKDLSITIEKQGNEPARIKVKKGEKSWETTAEKLSELPEDVRPFVQQLMGVGGPIAMPMRVNINQLPTAKYGVPGVRAQPVPPSPAAPRTSEMQLALPRTVVRSYQAAQRPSEQQTIEEVRRELEQLLKKVESLRTPPKAETPHDQLRREVEQLRKEVEALRKGSGR